MNEHDDAEADLRRPEFRYLTRRARADRVAILVGI